MTPDHTNLRPRVIVAEISRNYGGGIPEENTLPPISQQFERVIAKNAVRGYVLKDWRLASTMGYVQAGMLASSTTLNETIVAVFEQREELKEKQEQEQTADPRTQRMTWSGERGDVAFAIRKVLSDPTAPSTPTFSADQVDSLVTRLADALVGEKEAPDADA